MSANPKGTKATMNSPKKTISRSNAKTMTKVADARARKVASKR